MTLPRHIRRNGWRVWFAWYPVRLDNGRPALWRPVLRKRYYGGDSAIYQWWAYRELPL